jgi:hypothetical protein
MGQNFMNRNSRHVERSLDIPLHTPELFRGIPRLRSE